ncbi:MAG: amidohydrolase family protein [Gemmatimonadetes bacterium]|nr:amidohydrolase family protein [Gemmatimonadota bacterium]
MAGSDSRRRTPRSCSVVIALAAACGDAPIPETGIDESGVALVGGRWLDVETGQLVPNPGIAIVGDRIAAVDGSVQPAGDVVRLEDEWTILPGLIDLHAHYAVDLFGEGRVDETVAYPSLLLANGVTTTFPAGELDPVAMRELRLSIDRGERPGPRILNSGPYFGSWRRGWDGARMTRDSIFAEVDHWAARGARGFKAKGIRAEHLRPLIERAHSHGVTVTAHLDSGYGETVNPRDAIAMGIDRVEHFLGGDMMPSTRSAYASLQEFEDFDGPELRDIIALYVREGVNFDATLSIYGYWGPHDPEMTAYWTDELRFLTPYMRAVVEARPPRPVLESFRKMSPIKRRTARAFYENGGRDLMTMGTDHPSWGRYWSGFGAHRELLAMARAGIPPADVFRIASLNGAKAFGLEADLGSIATGKIADLFVVRGNPLEDVRRARDVEYVIARGTLHEAAALLASVEGTIGPSDASEEGRWRPER